MTKPLLGLLFLGISITTANAIDMKDLAPCRPAAARMCDRTGGLTMPPKAYRWVAEMHEIADFVGEDPSAHELYVGAAHFYEQIAADFDGDKSQVNALMAFLNKDAKK